MWYEHPFAGTSIYPHPQELSGHLATIQGQAVAQFLLTLIGYATCMQVRYDFPMFFSEVFVLDSRCCLSITGTFESFSAGAEKKL
jgi:hypothetical protein